MHLPEGRFTAVDCVGVFDFVSNIKAILDSQPEHTYKWVAPGLLAFLLREQAGLDHEDETIRERTANLAKRAIAGHKDSVARSLGISSDEVEECIDGATSEVECAWNERPKLALKPGKTEDRVDTQGNVILKPLVVNGENIKNKDGSPKLTIDKDVLTWKHQLKKVRLSYLEQARKVIGVHPREGTNFCERKIARILRNLDAGTGECLEVHEKKVRTRAIRRQRARERSSELSSAHRGLERIHSFRRLMDRIVG